MNMYQTSGELVNSWYAAGLASSFQKEKPLKSNYSRSLWSAGENQMEVSLHYWINATIGMPP